MKKEPKKSESQIPGKQAVFCELHGDYYDEDHFGARPALIVPRLERLKPNRTKAKHKGIQETR